MKDKTRLGYLMSQLEISGKQLAAELELDATSISKWRNAQRKLPYHSDAAKKIARYFLRNDLQRKRNLIPKLLSAYRSDVNLHDEEEVLDLLCLWLTEEGAPAPAQRDPKSAYNTSVRVYYGAEGIADALMTFVKNASVISVGFDLIVIDYGDIDFEHMEPERLKTLQRFMKEIAQKGNRVCIIDGANNSVMPYLTIFRWLDLYMTSNVEILYAGFHENNENKSTVFLIPQNSALYSMGLRQMPQEHHCFLFHDQRSVEFFQRVYETQMKTDLEPMYKLPVSDLTGITGLLDTLLLSGRVTFTLNPVPTFRSMSENLLLAVLGDNRVSAAVTEKCIAAIRLNRSVRERCHYRQIYDLAAMKEACTKPYIVDYDLSAVCGMEIVVSRQRLRTHLEELLEFKCSDCYQVALLYIREIFPDLPELSIIAQDDRLVVTWNPRLYPNRMYCQNLTIVGGFYRYLSELWHNAPSVCTTEAWKREQFIKMISELA